MTHDSCSKTLLLPPAAINTSRRRLWDDLATQQCVVVADDDSADYDQRNARSLQQKQSPSRRAKSHSPSRQSPKLKHTNGRLDEDPSFSHAQNDKQQLLARLQPTPLLPTLSHPKQLEKDEPKTVIPRRASLRRSITCAPHDKASSFAVSTSPTRFKICYRDEALRARSAENTRRMIVNARLTEPTVASAGEASSSNQHKLALKALKYRNLLARTNEINDARLQDPAFDVLACLGVKWCKV